MNKRSSVSKRVIAFMLVMMMVVGSTPGLFTTEEGRAYAAGGYSDGTGNVDDPYIVTTPDELNEIRFGLSLHYKLGNDIDLTSYLAEGGGGYNGGAYWSPIGSQFGPFNGTLDGDGYVIKGLKINKPLGIQQTGLFAFADSTAVIKNIGLENVDIIAQWAVGGLVGQSSATISNSFVTGNVLSNDVNNSSSSMIGGLVGYQAGGTVTNSYSSADTSGYHSVGELVGYQAGSVSYSYATGVVSTPHDRFNEGGLIGFSITAPTSSYYDTLTTTQDDTGKGTLKTHTKCNSKAHLF